MTSYLDKKNPMNMNRAKRGIKILHLFNRYLEYGGEEGCVNRIHETLSLRYQSSLFSISTADQLARPLGKYRMFNWMLNNPSVIKELRQIQEKEAHTVWLFHNVFPAISIRAYELAIELGIPMMQYLHNYRFGCPAGTLFRDNKICSDCSVENFKPALHHRCWRNSLPASYAMTRSLQRFWKNDYMSQIHAFFTTSEDQKLRHIQMGFPAEKIHVVKHLLNAEEEPFNEPPQNGDILFLGRLVQEKGIHLLLDAWSRVDRHGRKLRIVGEGSELVSIKEKISLYGLKDVILEGYVPREDHQEIWNKASFLVAPSTWLEPFGMIILEAWKHGRPVLATNHGSFPEIIKHQETGWLANPNTEAFARGLQLAIDSTSYSIMGKQGRNELINDYSQKAWLNTTSGIFDQMNVLT